MISVFPEPQISPASAASFPWENGSPTSECPVWRSGRNPIIPRNPFPKAAKVYNSAVIPFGQGYAGVFRADYRTGMPCLHTGWSDDGLHWRLDEECLDLSSDTHGTPFAWGYDPRVCLIEGSYYVTWCNGYHGPTIGVARTEDFKQFKQLENAFLPCNRNGVLFPKKINGNYAMLSRPSDQGHTPFGDIFYSESPDLCYWGKHRFVMGSKGKAWWQDTKIGAGPTPIETPEGWLMIYHGVANTCNGMVYSMGAALLDLERPWKVLYRSSQYLLAPEAPYETTGFVPNVLFPCAALHDEPTGRLAIYYGAADTVTALAFSKVELILEFLKKHSQI
jgi:beta-1,4-mannooligosaccharide/beta-1,4-mannosyl-N-acetylglucosamine phosphorylase